MNLENVEKAHYKTIEYFNDFWNNPNPDERDIFYQFLMMESFKILGFPPTLLSEFWTLYNTKAMMLGDEYFKLFCKMRDERFNVYMPLYEELAETPFFRKGGKPTESYEMIAIANFAGSVLHYVEKEFIPVTDAEKHLELSEICLFLVSVHLAMIRFEKG